MTENHTEQPSRKEGTLPFEERSKIQGALIEEFCRIKEIPDAAKRKICALEWIEKYADNFDQLDKALIEKYRQATDNDERNSALDEIQKALEMLNNLNG